MRVLYLLVLLAAIACIMIVDRRFRLVLWRAPRRATAVLLIGLGFFLAWDLLGIARGTTSISTGILLAPELPLEELFFLAFLCYLTMVLVTGFRRVLAREKVNR